MKNKIIEKLEIKIFADGANFDEMIELSSKSYIKGLTTNPTLMNKAGISNYEKFAKKILNEIKNKPISFEVFSDDFDEMQRQAELISSWANNVYVKIPITNTKKASSNKIIQTLSNNNVKLNITAIMTLDQVKSVLEFLNPEVPNYISIFAGRIADTGVDPIPIMEKSLELMKINKNSELIWASPRELLNIFQANNIGCHVITVTKDILNKLNLLGYDLESYSLDTVKMFFNDASEAGYKL